MKSHKIIGNFALAAGILLALSSLMHFFSGYPAINEMITRGNAGAEIAHAFRVIWVFSSITMCLTGIWGIFISKGLKAGQKSAWWQGLALGLGMVFFCLAAQFIKFPNYGMMLFGVIGLLLVVPLLIGKRNFQ
ncbi:MAG: hypothetical protein IPM82_09765 [Saprospiraceae bacterium]|nr:hypothetical protein [Saprospiraceae bacterium]